jgi:hypothetical protein
MKTLGTFIKFHRVIQMASCDQIGDYHWLNCSCIINEFEKIIVQHYSFEKIIVHPSHWPFRFAGWLCCSGRADEMLVFDKERLVAMILIRGIKSAR